MPWPSVQGVSLRLKATRTRVDLPEEKRLHFNEETPRLTESRARRKLQLRVVSPRLTPMRQVKDSPTRRAIKQGMTVLKFVTSPKPSGRNRRKNRTRLRSSTAQSGCVGGDWHKTKPGMLP